MKDLHTSVAQRNAEFTLETSKRKNRIKRILKGLDSPNTGVSNTAIKDALKLLLRDLV